MKICIHRKGAKRHIGNPKVQWMVCKKCAREAELNYGIMRDIEILRALSLLHAYRWGLEL